MKVELAGPQKEALLKECLWMDKNDVDLAGECNETSQKCEAKQLSSMEGYKIHSKFLYF